MERHVNVIGLSMVVPRACQVRICFFLSLDKFFHASPTLPRRSMHVLSSVALGCSSHTLDDMAQQANLLKGK